MKTMKNLLKETLDGMAIEEFAERIAWAKICTDIDNEQRIICLEPEHTKEGAIEFLKKLDFEYDNDFGWQEVYGTIKMVLGLNVENMMVVNGGNFSKYQIIQI